MNPELGPYKSDRSACFQFSGKEVSKELTGGRQTLVMKRELLDIVQRNSTIELQVASPTASRVLSGTGLGPMPIGAVVARSRKGSTISGTRVGL